MSRLLCIAVIYLGRNSFQFVFYGYLINSASNYLEKVTAFELCLAFGAVVCPP